jgi:putative ABC transport system permease protein
MDLWVQNFVAKRETRIWIVIARLKPGISIRKAQAELDVIEARLARQYPEQKGYGARVQPLQIYLYGNFKNQFLAFFGAVVLVLLIACLNVANLLLARGTAREKEMAVRSSLGAGRPRLIRQLLTESLLLSALGAALGLLFAYAAIRFAIYLSPGDAMPREDEISINWHVLGSAVLLVLLTGWLFGLFPALRASKPDLTESLKEGGHRPVAHLGGSRIQNVLVIGQIALSLLLLVGAGMLIHNVWCALYANYGFKADHLAQLSIQLIPSEYMESIGDGSVARMKPKTALTIQSIKDRLRVLPGVSSVSVSSIGVFSGCNDRPMSSAGPPRRDSVQSACYEPVSLGYFGMLEIPVLKGRVFTEGDSSGSPPVAVISQSVVERYFPGQDPIGKMINIGSSESNDFERRQVVGVVGDIQWAVNWPIHSAVYYPYSQMPVQFPSMEGEYERLRVTFLVRSEVNPATLVRVMDRVVPEVARNVAISESETVDSIRRVRSQWTRFYTWLLVAFTATALALAAVGMFGVMSYEASQRTHEMGIRMALGARSRDVLRLILRNGILMTSVGMAIGLGTSLALGRFLESRLGEFSASEVKPMDLSTLAVVSILLAVVALLACYLPARRATKVVSMAVLRHE